MHVGSASGGGGGAGDDDDDRKDNSIQVGTGSASCTVRQNDERRMLMRSWDARVA